MDADIAERGFVVRRKGGAIDVSSPQPLAERFAVLGAAVYAVAIVVEAVRSRAWLAALLFIVIAAAALWVANARVRFHLDRTLLEVTSHFPSRDRAMRVATVDVLDFVVSSTGLVRVVTRDGRTVDLPRGTIRSHDEARALAMFLRGHLGTLREQEASYRSF